jgi:hypothetical protein
MDERARRIGNNEAVFRKVNEQIETMNRAFAAISDGMLHIVCECGMLECSQTLPVTVSTYEDVRSDSALFLLAPGHELPDVESVVEATSRYSVVRKHPGTAEAVAEATDPRR